MGDFGVVLDFRLLTYLKYAPHQKLRPPKNPSIYGIFWEDIKI